MLKYFIGFGICVLVMIWGFIGLDENLAAIHNVFLLFGAGIGMVYFGWNVLSELLRP